MKETLLLLVLAMSVPLDAAYPKAPSIIISTCETSKVPTFAVVPSP